jgi:adenylate kinase
MLGPPGAGKGTQADRFARDRGVPKISTGDILRDAVQAGTELGRAAKAVMEAGHLVSDPLMIGIVRDRLTRPDTSAGFVLDGFPRTLPQAMALDDLMDDRAPLVIIDIEVPEETLVARLTARRVCGVCGATAEPRATACARCGGTLAQRRDDDDDVIRKRLSVYRHDTQPIVDFYRPRPTFRSVDGDQMPDAVSADIASAVAAALGGTT